MPAAYPELDPPQEARFPLPSSEFPESRGLASDLAQRIEADPFHLLALLACTGVGLHLWWGVLSQGKSRRVTVPEASGWKAQVCAYFTRSPHAPLALWLAFLVAAGLAVHGSLETGRFALADGRHRFIWHLAVVCLLAFSRPGQLLVEILFEKSARLLGNTRTAWWVVLVIGGPLLGALTSVVAVVPVTCRLLRLHVDEGGGAVLRRMTRATFFLNLSLAAGLGLNAGNALPVAAWHLWDFWRWRVLVVLLAISFGVLVAMRRRLRLGSRLLADDPDSEAGKVPAWTAWLTGALLVGLVFLPEHPGWLAMIPLGFGVLLSTVGIHRPFVLVPKALPLLLLGVLWLPLGRSQHWWTSAILDRLPDWADAAFFSVLSALLGTVAGHSFLPSPANHAAHAGVFGLGGLGLAAYATWLAQSEDGHPGISWRDFCTGLLLGGIATTALVLLS